MKRLVEVEIPDGLFCSKGNSLVCPFHYWADGGFEQCCTLYNNTPLISGLYTNEGNLDKSGTYMVKKCNQCLQAEGDKS